MPTQFQPAQTAERPVDDLSIVARELRIARESLHLSREQLAERLGYSSSYIEKIETGKLAITEQYVTAATAALAEGIDTAGLFGRLREDGLKRPVMSQWLRDWLHIEQQATELRWFEPPADSRSTSDRSLRSGVAGR